MTSPIEPIKVECPACGTTYDDWMRGSINLDLDDVDDDYARRPSFDRRGLMFGLGKASRAVEPESIDGLDEQPAAVAETLAADRARLVEIDAAISGRCHPRLGQCSAMSLEAAPGLGTGAWSYPTSGPSQVTLI